jgi:type I restriction enzyme M protein
VISLPSGVFKPYAGVSTAIIIFAKGGKTENVFFYDMQSDGRTLDDKRTKIGDGNGDMPDVQAKYLQWCNGKGDFNDRTAKAFEVSADEIRAQSYDLSINRYKLQVHDTVHHVDPKELLQQLQSLEADILQDLADLEGLLV